MEIIRYSFCTFNLVFCIVGLALIGSGIWLLLDDPMLASSFRVIQIDDELPTGSLSALLKLPSEEVKEEPQPQTMILPLGYLCIIFGLAIFFLSFIGYCGAVHDSKCLLGTFAVLLAFIIILEIIAIAFFFYNRPSVEASAKNHFKMIFQEKYSAVVRANKRGGRVLNRPAYSYPTYTDTTSTTPDPSLERSDLATMADVTKEDFMGLRNNFKEIVIFTKIMDATMKYYSCCGVTDYTDFRREQLPEGQVVPEACCKFFNDTTPLKSTCVSQPNFSNSYYLTGCFDKVVTSITDNAIIVGVIVGILQLIGFAFSVSGAVMVYRQK